MAMEWPSVAKCHVVKILKLGPIHMHEQHGDIIKLISFGGGLRKESKLKIRRGYS